MTNGKSPGSDGLKPFCVSLIINGNRGLILLAITAEAILRSVFNKLIGLQFIKLTEEQKYLCEGNITFKECAQSS
jgi:hypothetical protein